MDQSTSLRNSLPHFEFESELATKKFILTLLMATAFLSLAGSSARAEVVSTGGSSISQKLGIDGILSRLIELERHKNAALR